MGWLRSRGTGKDIENALLPVLDQLWADAYQLGFGEAAEASGYNGQADPTALRDLIDRLGRHWASEIAQVRLERIAAALESGDDAVSLVEAATNGHADAERIAQTEVVRAAAAGATAAYRAAGVHQVRWVTGGPDPCPLCIANENAGPQPLGKAFPSGPSAPPQHPNCHCALVPA